MSGDIVVRSARAGPRLIYSSMLSIRAAGECGERLCAGEVGGG